MTLTILGQPITAKNSRMITTAGKRCPTCRRRTGRHFLIPSSAAAKWEKDAKRQIAAQLPTGFSAIQTPIVMRALIYRGDARSSDMLNHLAAVSDLIQATGVVVNDRLVMSTDGSRLRIDRENPRVEITIEPFTEAIDTAPLKPRRAKPAPSDDDEVPIS